MHVLKCQLCLARLMKDLDTAENTGTEEHMAYTYIRVHRECSSNKDTKYRIVHISTFNKCMSA